MEKIAEILKERRKALNLSIEEISKRTRLTVKHIKAIESGDLSFFNDDLAYLRYFVKAYCDAVNIDFDELKDDLRKSVDDFTTSTLKIEEVKHEEIKKNIDKHKPLTIVGNNKYVSRGDRFLNKTKKIDTSLITLVIVGVVVICVVVGSIIFLTKDNRPIKNDEATAEKIPVASVDDEKIDVDNNSDNNEVIKDNEEVKEMEIVKDGITTYTINNLKKGDTLVIESTFNGSNCGYSATINGNNTIDSQTYKIGTKARNEVVIDDNTTISLWYGCMVEVHIEVNGQVLKTDDSINPSLWPGVCPTETLTLKIGELYEYTE